MIALILHKYGVPLNDPCCYPLGFMYVSALLKKLGHEVKVLNYNLHDYDLDRELEGVTDVFMTGFEEFKNRIIDTAKLCKDKGIKTHVGGALATFAPDLLAQHIDYLYHGEFDHGIDLSAIPYPDYDGFGVREYHRRNGIKHMGVLASRGCPYICTFCAQTCSFRCRRVSDVFSEIDHYKANYGAELIIFNDNTLNINKSRFMAICEGMKSRAIAWSAAIRVDVFDEDMARAAKESGCKYFVVGIESFNQSKLDRMNKGITVDQLYRTLDLLHKYGINYHGNVLFGFQGETESDISAELAAMPQGYNVFPSMVQPFLGTADGHNRAISGGQYARINSGFKQYIESKGKYCYPEAA